jgi:GAF domain-containing protein
VAPQHLEALRRCLEDGGATLGDRARRAAERLREERRYRWVGIYRVAGSRICAIGWTGAFAPAYPDFPATQGLCGAAVQSGRTMMVGDVSRDPHYLTTFGSTKSEIVVPVRRDGVVVGLIDVESERLDAFDDVDRAFLEGSAAILAEYWD